MSADPIAVPVGRERLQQLAVIGAREAHIAQWEIGEGDDDPAGHVGAFATCPHPDCVLVRESALSAALAPPQTDWQPIASAPRDSGRLLVFCPSDDPTARTVFEAWWRVPYEGAPPSQCWWCYDRDKTMLSADVHRSPDGKPLGATLWMSIPVAPTPEVQRAALAPPVGPTQLAQPAGTTEKDEPQDVRRNELRGNAAEYAEEVMRKHERDDLDVYVIEAAFMAGVDCAIDLDAKPDRASPPAGVQEQGWQPMETAPNDETPVLAWWSQYQHEGYRIICQRSNGTWKHIANGFNVQPPTHWMPLPPSPSSEKD